MDKLICKENCEYDILKLDDESSDDSSLVIQVPAPVENQIQVQVQENVNATGQVENQVQLQENQNENENENVNGLAIEIVEEPGTTDRRCRAYIEAKGRRCARTAIRKNIYCCAHFSSKKGKSVDVRTPLCGGITILGSRCKHRSLYGHTFCKKHLRNVEKGQTSNSKCCTRSRTRSLKRKFEENCTEMVLVHPEIPLEINPVSVINRDDSFLARNILGETLMLSGTDRNEIKALQWIGSPSHGNDQTEDSCFDNENGIKCKICFEEFFDDQTLGNHWMENHEKEAHWLFRSYACAMCLDSFKNKKQLESHVQERHRVQFFDHSVLLICNPCGKDFENMDELWIHVMSAHPAELKLSPEKLTLSAGEDSLKMIEYGNEASLNNNSMIPSGSQKPCRFCGLKFDLISDLNRHREAVHMENNLPSWVEASYRFGRRTRSNLNRRSHAKKTEPQPNNSLDILTSTDTGKDSLKMIEYGNGASLNNNSMIPSGSQKLVCRFCGLKFDLISDLNRHREAVHMEDNLASWVEASNRFGRRTRSNLNRRSHAKKTEPQPNTGEDSLKMIEYGNEASLNQNSMIPSGSQKLVCRFCGLKFDILSDLNHHRQAVHIEDNLPSWVEASNRFGRRARSNLNRRSHAKKTEPQPNNSLEILSSTACAECCQDNLEASLKEKYGYLPARLNLKATKLSIELASG